MNQITVTDAAIALNVSGQRIRAMIKSKTIKATKIGRDWIIKQSDIAPLIDRESLKHRKNK